MNLEWVWFLINLILAWLYLFLLLIKNEKQQRRKKLVSNVMQMCEWQRVSVGGTHVLPFLLSAESSNKDKHISHHSTSVRCCAGGYFLWLILDTRSQIPVVFADLAVEMCVVFVSYVYMVYSSKPDLFSPHSCLKCQIVFFFSGNGDLFFFGSRDGEVELELG